MKIVLRKRAINAILKCANFVEADNTPGSGNRWLEKVNKEIMSLAESKAKFAFCRHPSLAKFNYRCYAWNDWIIAFRITENEFVVCRFVLGSRLG
jgi:hypothetical protein